MAPPTLWNPALDAELCRMWAEGMSSRHIAPRLGVSRSAVLERVRRLRMIRMPDTLQMPHRRHSNRAASSDEPAVPAVLVEESIRVSLAFATAWAREHAKDARTVADVNRVRDAHTLPRFLVRAA